MKKIYIILLFLSPLFLKAQTGCSDPAAPNYYCNTAFDCVMVGFDSNFAPIWDLPPGFTDDGSCIYYGCTDPNADNYDSTANTDNGTCIISGCTDDGQQSWSVTPGSPACNYDSSATTSDGSCQYPEQYYDCYGNCINDTDGDNTCDEIDNCPLIYNPNQDDFNNDGIGDACDGVNLDEENNFEWNIYPNPFKDYTIVQFENPDNKKFKIEILSLSGKSVYQAYTSGSQYHIRNCFASGYYIIQLESNDNIIRETLIVE